MPCFARRMVAVALALGLLLAAWPTAATSSYEVHYRVELVPAKGLARIAITIDGAARPDALLIRAEAERYVRFAGDGEIERNGEQVVWRIPANGGQLRYDVRVEHRRTDEKGLDAAITDRWALFRGEDLFPPTATDGPENEAVADLEMVVPEGWSVVTPYPERKSGLFEIEQPHRFHDRPTGWILAGHLAVTRETIAGVKVAIANPVGHDLHRLDILALLRWTLADLVQVLPDHGDRFAIVGAADPMWRGGLSGPRSLYLHADRPLIDRDGTSPILHEMMHAFMHARAGADGDWIVEGLAEYYSLAFLRRSNTFTQRRYEHSLDKLAKKAKDAPGLLVPHANAAVAARGAVVLAALDARIRKETDGEKTLDDVVRALEKDRAAVTTARFREISEGVSGVSLAEFFREYVGR